MTTPGESWPDFLMTFVLPVLAGGVIGLAAWITVWTIWLKEKR